MQALQEKANATKIEIEQFVVENTAQLEAFRIQFLGSKNVIKDLFAEMKNIAPEQRKEAGQILNSVKEAAEQRFAALQESLQQKSSTQRTDLDLTLPTTPFTIGSRHPLTLVQERIVEIFERMGYNVSEAQEIEDDWHNFSALNFPPNHPARDMQDTFFVGEKAEMLLRTHTSSVQVRLMEQQKPPIRSIMPGRVYRNEAISARAHCVFHQIEGLYINENVSFAELKQTLYYFVRELFGQQTKIRFRASYFPFTEPSAEVDISCLICGGDGCNVCKHSGWVEIAGCGMVDPAVLENCGIDSQKYTGFAFGMGVERIAMLKYGVNDLRLYTENDVRFLRQFTAV